MVEILEACCIGPHHDTACALLGKLTVCTSSCKPLRVRLASEQASLSMRLQPAAQQVRCVLASDWCTCRAHHTAMLQSAPHSHVQPAFHGRHAQAALILGLKRLALEDSMEVNRYSTPAGSRQYKQACTQQCSAAWMPHVPVSIIPRRLCDTCLADQGVIECKIERVGKLHRVQAALLHIRQRQVVAPHLTCADVSLAGRESGQDAANTCHLTYGACWVERDECAVPQPGEPPWRLSQCRAQVPWIPACGCCDQGGRAAPCTTCCAKRDLMTSARLHAKNVRATGHAC